MSTAGTWPEGQRQKAETPDRDAIAQSAQRVRSVSPALSVVPDAAVPGDPESPSAGGAERARQAAERLREQLAKALTGESLLKVDPPSVGTIWAAHREAAGQWNAALATGGRTAWGVFHVAVVCVLYGLLWVLFSPVRCTVAAALLTVWIVWS